MVICFSEKKSFSQLPFEILCVRDVLFQAGFEDENALQTPIVRYAAVSSIEHSHLSPVTDIQWLPDHMEVS